MSHVFFLWGLWGFVEDEFSLLFKYIENFQIKSLRLV